MLINTFITTIETSKSISNCPAVLTMFGHRRLWELKTIAKTTSFILYNIKIWSTQTDKRPHESQEVAFAQNLYCAKVLDFTGTCKLACL